MAVENSGGSCDYYKIFVEHPYFSKKPYTAECGEIIEALELNVYEASAFKEIWRMATARQGKEKQGNSPLRGAEKMAWNSNRLLEIAKRAK